MTLFTRTQHRVGTLIPSPRVFWTAGLAFLRMLRNRRAVHQVSELPDYLLNDLGLRRDDVHEALNRGWREDPSFQLALKASKRRRGL